MSSTDASASLQGYLYQKLVAMYLACRFLIINNSLNDDELKKWHLSIEIGGDDIVICKGIFNGQNFSTKEEIHLFQTKHTKKNDCNYHKRAIRQLYLNKKKHENEGRPTVYLDFITKEALVYDNKKYHFTVTNTSTELSILDCLNDGLGSVLISDFPNQYSSLSFPTLFSITNYSLSTITPNTNEFQSLSFDYIQSYLQHYIPSLNSTITIGSEQIYKLYFKLTKKIFDNKYISLFEIKEIFSQSLTETLDELISNGSDEWELNLKKDQFLRKIGDLFDIEDILNEINSTITYNHDDVTNLLSERFDDLNKYIKELEKKDFDDFLYKITLKDVVPINNQQDFIDFGSKNIPDDIVFKWLKIYLHCYMRCEQKSFDDVFLITGIDTQSIKNIINQSLYTLYHYPQKVIGSYGHNYSKNGTIVDFTKEDLEKAGIKAIRYINQSQDITKPYEVCLCCMEHICDSGLNVKFRKQDQCSRCKTKFNSL